jgi:hypothetical protein
MGEHVVLLDTLPMKDFLSISVMGGSSVKNRGFEHMFLVALVF